MVIFIRVGFLCIVSTCPYEEQHAQNLGMIYFAHIYFVVVEHFYKTWMCILYGVLHGKEVCKDWYCWLAVLYHIVFVFFQSVLLHFENEFIFIFMIVIFQYKIVLLFIWLYKNPILSAQQMQICMYTYNYHIVLNSIFI